MNLLSCLVNAVLTMGGMLLSDLFDPLSGDVVLFPPFSVLDDVALPPSFSVL